MSPYVGFWGGCNVKVLFISNNNQIVMLWTFVGQNVGFGWTLKSQRTVNKQYQHRSFY